MKGDREMVHEVTSSNFDGCAGPPLPLAAASRASRRARSPKQDGRGHEAGGELDGAVAGHLCAPRPRAPAPARRRLTPPPRRAATFVPGCYALRVKGTLHAQHITVLEDNGIRYRSLDDEAAR